MFHLFTVIYLYRFIRQTNFFTGHRIRTVHAFGMVVLEILGTKIEDSGTYTCRATNKWGKAEISVTLECIDKSKGQKPKFTTHIKVTVLFYYLNIRVYINI